MSQVRTTKVFSFIYYPIVVNITLLKAIGVLVFIVLTGLGAFVRIPLCFTPVPVTLQTFFVLLSGAMLGKKFGFFSQAGYLMLGMAGVPLFAGAAAGITCLLGPSGGYLFGFMAASFLAGVFLSRQNKSFVRIISVFFMATVVIWTFGTIWLKIVLGISLPEAIFMGTVPFIAGDLLKLTLAAAVYNRLKFKF